MLEITNNQYLDDCYTELKQKQATLIEQYKVDSFDMFSLQL